ncbi:type I restriction endonuclease [Calothrix sp. PCC 6303]|uniref:type I restriction endonuclease n=1 Tax=Calothrix sp. PCC 6303 TaxID=1170562 RepID=UPI0002A0538A|nr:type I restriction endonuclease [Calothrix sp. PCC 6303]AFZ00230.1 Restriction endonuclease, type I, EcoRI, R subunit/Type III [Calothrix sp. PCC 6303]
MVQTIQASELSLGEVEQKFNLQENLDLSFFPEWQNDLPELSETEKQTLDKIKSNFLYLSKYPMSEEVVKLVVISPLLSLAGFYSPPFRLRTENPIKIALEKDDEEVRGRIDILVLQELLWVLVIESKEAGFSLIEAIPQALTYMMATPTPQIPAYSLVTNGSEFRFIKLQVQPTPEYSFSDLFTLQRRHNDLYGVASILNKISDLISK